MKKFKIAPSYNSVGECIKDLIYMAVATFIIAVAVYFFMKPSNTAISSVSALAIVLANIIPLTVAQLTMIMNIILLIIGFILFGSEFGFKTIYTSILLPVFLRIFEIVRPENVSFTDDPFLDVILYVTIVSFGAALLFNDNASSGGLDIVAKILNKYLHIELGKAMSIAGILIACSTIFFYDTKSVILSLLGTYINGLVLDHFIFGQNVKRRVCIITDKQKLVRNFILYDLQSGATLYEATGAYDMKTRQEIICIVTKQEYQKLMTFLEQNDPNAFVTVYTVSEIRYMPKTFGIEHHLKKEKEQAEMQR
ncbi:MAG: YitT family protein [Lachnospiraceae bacterium]|nr:YitT family protein [Lachnospiraceae bacterium]